jgi:AcrR family transcriptional regulator
MRKMLLTTAIEMMGRGITPTIAELAEGADVSRATAYRYFATQGELISAVVDESLGPILAWQSDLPTAAERVDALLRDTYPRLEEYEVPLRAAVQVSLQQRAQLRAGLPASEPAFVRGNRIERLHTAALPMKERLDDAQFDRVLRALSLLYGTEVFIVLKDIWHLQIDEIIDVVRWTAGAILQRAEREAVATDAIGATAAAVVTPLAAKPRADRPLRKAAGIGVAAKKVEKLAKEAAAKAALKTAEAAPATEAGAAGAAAQPAVPRAARPPTQRIRRKPGR